MTDNSPSPSVGASAWRNWRLWLFLLFCLLGSSVASFVAFKYLGSSIPPELVGTWQVSGGGLRGATLEFRPDGSAIGVLYDKGQKEVTRSSVRVEGKTIFLTTSDERTGKNETTRHAILKLTEDELVFRDEDGSSYRMTRLRE